MEEFKHAIGVPSAALLQDPKEGARVEDIVRYGTIVSIAETRDGWARVTHESWGGWLLQSSLIQVPADMINAAKAMISFRGGYLFHVPDTERGPHLHLPFESPVEVMEELPEQGQRWLKVKLLDGSKFYLQRSQALLSRKVLTLAEAVEFSKQFLGLNYLYGGTTSFGYDCSGFVQMIYRQMGTLLPRNSYQQALDPRFVEVDRATAGDLIFFFNANGKVVHVGMMVDSERFIHAFTKQEAWICYGLLCDHKWRDGAIYSGYVVKRKN